MLTIKDLSCGVLKHCHGKNCTYNELVLGVQYVSRPGDLLYTTVGCSIWEGLSPPHQAAADGHRSNKSHEMGSASLRTEQVRHIIIEEHPLRMPVTV